MYVYVYIYICAPISYLMSTDRHDFHHFFHFILAMAWG